MHRDNCLDAAQANALLADQCCFAASQYNLTWALAEPKALPGATWQMTRAGPALLSLDGQL